MPQQGFHGLAAPEQGLLIILGIDVAVQGIEQATFDFLGQAWILEAFRKVGNDFSSMPSPVDLGASEAGLQLVEQIPHPVQPLAMDQLPVEDHDLVCVQLEDAPVHEAHLQFGVRAVAFPENGVLQHVQILDIPAFELQSAPDGFQSEFAILHTLQKAGDQEGQLELGGLLLEMDLGHGLGEEFGSQVVQGSAQGLLFRREGREAQEDRALHHGLQGRKCRPESVPQGDGVHAAQAELLPRAHHRREIRHEKPAVGNGFPLFGGPWGGDAWLRRRAGHLHDGAEKRAEIHGQGGWGRGLGWWRWCRGRRGGEEIFQDLGIGRVQLGRGGRGPVQADEGVGDGVEAEVERFHLGIRRGYGNGDGFRGVQVHDLQIGSLGQEAARPPHLLEPLGAELEGKEEQLQFVLVQPVIEGDAADAPGIHLLGQGLGRIGGSFHELPLVPQPTPGGGEDDGAALLKQLLQ